jgi:hypothetical protein
MDESSHVSRRLVGTALAGAAAGFAGMTTLTAHGTSGRGAAAIGEAELTAYLQDPPYVEPAYYLTPSGDTTGATDVTQINSMLAAGQPVLLIPGATYYINAPITPTTGSVINGGQWWSATDSDVYTGGGATGQTGGALIIMTAGFSGAAAIYLADPGDPATSQQWGVDISGLTIEGHELTSGSAHGIYVVGAWGACFLRGVCVHRPPQCCLRFDVGTDDGIGDDWYIEGCKFSAARAGYGFWASHLDDSWIVACESSENNVDGWYLDHGVNTRFVGCKGENNGGNGWQLAGLNATQTVLLSACTTHLNKEHGFLFNNAGTGGGLGTYLLTGCLAQQDGQAGGDYAGFASHGCLSRVSGTGCHVDTSTTGPKYGAEQESASYGTCFTGSRLQGVTGATYDDGSNTHALVNQSPVPF